MWQPRRGYRYGGEVYALAGFALDGHASGSPAFSAVDLGTGSGVVALLLAAAGLSVTAVEREPRWVALARRSVADSGLDVPVIEADIRGWRGGEFDLAVANPPWFPADQPVSPDPWRAASRSMIHGEVRDFVETGLAVAPRLCLVTRPERRDQLVMPGSYVARRAMLGDKLLFVELRRGEGLTVDEPLDLERLRRRWRPTEG